MANVDNPNGFVALYKFGGGTVPTMCGWAASNASINVGDALVMATTGRLTIATAASTAIYGVAIEKIVGVAATPQLVKFNPALEDVVFSGQCSGTMAQTDIGESVDIEGGTGVMEINEDASSTAVAKIIALSEFPLGNAVGANARVDFIWQKSSFTGQA